MLCCYCSFIGTLNFTTKKILAFLLVATHEECCWSTLWIFLKTRINAFDLREYNFRHMKAMYLKSSFIALICVKTYMRASVILKKCSGGLAPGFPLSGWPHHMRPERGATNAGKRAVGEGAEAWALRLGVRGWNPQILR
jgi:hypothetical protein